MKWQTEIIIFIVVLNLATGVVTELGTPGTSIVNPSPQTNASEYEDHFNVTEVADWKAGYGTSIPILGDIFYGFNTFFRLVSYVFVGFPVFLYSWGDNFITDPAGLAAYNTIVAALIAMFMVVMTFYLIWFISGRDM